MATTAFGRLLRSKRLEAKLSLREVAEKVGVSHVYLGEVERGVRRTINPERWEALLAAIPGLRRVELEHAAAASKVVGIDVADKPPEYQDLALALARRIEQQDLTKVELSKLLSFLGGER